MDGIAGVTMVRSSDESRIDRQRGAMMSAVAIPDGLAAKSISCCAPAPPAGPLSAPLCWLWLLPLMLSVMRSAWPCWCVFTMLAAGAASITVATVEAIT